MLDGEQPRVQVSNGASKSSRERSRRVSRSNPASEPTASALSPLANFPIRAGSQSLDMESILLQARAAASEYLVLNSRLDADAAARALPLLCSRQTKLHNATYRLGGARNSARSSCSNVSNAGDPGQKGQRQATLADASRHVGQSRAARLQLVDGNQSIVISKSSKLADKTGLGTTLPCSSAASSTNQPGLTHCNPGGRQALAHSGKISRVSPMANRAQTKSCVSKLTATGACVEPAITSLLGEAKRLDGELAQHMKAVAAERSNQYGQIIAHQTALPKLRETLELASTQSLNGRYEASANTTFRGLFYNSQDPRLNVLFRESIAGINKSRFDHAGFRSLETDEISCRMAAE